MNSISTKIITIFLLLTITACASQDKKKTDQEQAQNIPKLKRPEVRRVWVPDQIIGDEYVSGHWKYLIEKNAVWTKEN
jgi:hypothetical protein